MAGSRKYYLRSVAHRWKQEVAAATERVILHFPFITTRAVEMVLGEKRPPRCEVYTRFEAQHFASGASSLDALKRLLDMGVRLYELPRLHAKLLIVPGRFASVGSQNLTAQGFRNREATVAVTSPKGVAQITRLAEGWAKFAIAITPERVREMEALVEPLRQRYLAFAEEAAGVDAALRRAEFRRDLARQVRAGALQRTVRLRREPPADNSMAEMWVPQEPDEPDEWYDGGIDGDEELSEEDLRLLKAEAADDEDTQAEPGTGGPPDGGEVTEWEEDAIQPGERLWALRRSVAFLARGGHPVRARVRHVRSGSGRALSLVASDRLALSCWWAGDGPVALKPTHRYVCMLDEEPCKWGWARLMRWRISFISSVVRFQDAVQLGDRLCRLTLLAEWDDAAALQRNLVVEVRPALSPDVAIHGTRQL
jgi:hypothetical protein